MNILVIGTGYVGLVSGACFSEFGFKVICIDHDIDKIKNLKKGNIPIYEPGLNELVKKNISNKNLNFDTNPNKYLNKSDCVFLAVFCSRLGPRFGPRFGIVSGLRFNLSSELAL